MNVARIIVPIGCVLLLLGSCKNKDSESPYSDLLSRPPFAGLTDSISHDRKNDALYFRRAVLLNSNNLPEPALADFKKAWSLRKEEKYALGVSRLLLERNADSAILFLNSALEDVPNSLLLRLSLARAYDAQNKPDEALKVCDDILAHNPQQVDVLKFKADLLARKGMTADAITVLEKAYVLTPFDVELNYILALKYAENKNPKIIALCDSLIRADSLDAHAEPYYYKGIYYSNINDKQTALANFDEAIQHDYYFLDGYIEKASVFYDLKKYPEAIKTLNLALTISPKFADAYYWLGKCQEATGLKGEAKLNYQRAFSLDKNLTEAKVAADRLQP